MPHPANLRILTDQMYLDEAAPLEPQVIADIELPLRSSVLLTNSSRALFNGGLTLSTALPDEENDAESTAP